MVGVMARADGEVEVEVEVETGDSDLDLVVEAAGLMLLEEVLGDVGGGG